MFLDTLLRARARTDKRLRTHFCILVLFLLAACALTIFNIIAFPRLFQLIVNSQVLLIPGTLSFTQWLAPTPPVYKVVTVYNITNPSVVLTGGQPSINPVGPYWFREYREKTDVAVPVSNPSHIWFSEKKWYVWDEERTNSGSLGEGNRSLELDPFTDIFTTINIAYVGVATNLTLEGAPLLEISEAIIAAALENEQDLFMNRTVREVVFGYKDPFLDILRIKMPTLPNTVQLIYNMSSDDVTKRSTVHSGVGNVSMLGQYVEWEGYTELPWWGTEESNTLNGTEGLFFNPDMDRSKLLSIWTDDMFRSVILEFEGEEELMGMHTYRYGTPGYGMENATLNPHHKGFYCFGPNGLLNLTAAVNAPVMVSKPSFLQGDDFLHEEITGLAAPNSSTMDTSIWVEPTTGVLVKAIKQLQINIQISRYPLWPTLDKLREKPRYIPIALVQELGGLDDTLLHTFKYKVFSPRTALEGVLWGLVGACVVGVVVCAVLAARVVYESDKRKPLLPEVEKDENTIQKRKKRVCRNCKCAYFEESGSGEEFVVESPAKI